MFASVKRSPLTHTESEYCNYINNKTAQITAALVFIPAERMRVKTELHWTDRKKVSIGTVHILL